jgi:hypothetical protein
MAVGPDWRSSKTKTVDGHISVAAYLSGGKGGCPDFALYRGIRLNAEEKCRITSVRVSERCVGEHCWARLVNLTKNGSLDWPVDPSHPWLARQATSVNPQSA